jgi:hypothetical protein
VQERHERKLKKNNMDRTIGYTLLLAICFHFSCKDSGTSGGGGGTSINPNIIRVKYCCSDFNGGNFRMGVWLENKIFAVAPGRLLDINAQFESIKDTLVLWPGAYLFVSRNSVGSRLLTVKSQFSDVSLGRLLELDIQTLTLRLLRDSAYNVSSALYMPNQNSCIYYSYGNPSRQIPAGYYALDLSTLQDSLLFQYVSEIGPAEVTNGFGVSPDGRKLLLPITRATESPLIVEYTFSSGVRETLNVSFNRQLLWLRYHPSNGQILYSNYPRGAGGSSVATDSEIGIIDRSNLTKKVLDVNTRAGGLSVCVFPNWSPDGKHILYGSAPGPAQEPPGAKGAYSLYILRNVN